MRIARLLFPLFLLPVAAFGQAVRYDSNVTTSSTQGPAGASAPVLTMPRAQITVCGYPNTGDPCTNTVPLFSDQAMTQPLSNPITSDGRGRFGFWVAPGLYTYSVQSFGGSNVGTFPLSLNSPPGPQGPGGTGCGVAQCLISAPTLNQAIIQPSGTGFTVNSLNGALNPTLFPGADLGAQINAAFVTCTLNCVVFIPPGTYSYTTTIQMTKPGQSLIGLGSAFTRLNYNGSGDAVLWQMNPFTATKAGTLKGLTFACTNSAVNCIHSGTLQGSTWEDLVIFGATNANAAGILLENINQGGFSCWTERTYMHNVHLGVSGSGNSVGLDFRTNGGTDSFGYSDISVWLNMEAGQVGILSEAGTAPYHSTIDAKGNIDVEPATFIKVNGSMVNDRIFIVGESTGTSLAAVANDIVVGASGQVTAQGSIVVSNSIGGVPNNNLSAPNIAAGGIYKVGAYTDFNYPGGSNFATSQTNVTSKSFTPISADGTLRVAVGGSLSGRFTIEWPSNANRYDVMTVDMACGIFDGQPCYLSSSDYAIGGQTVFTNPQIFRDSSSTAPNLVVTVGNRNGVAQNAIVTWTGSVADEPSLFPTTGTLGSTPQVTYGFSVSQNGTNIVTPSLHLNGVTLFTGPCAPTTTLTVVGGLITGCS